jgi:hypothetical protein
LAQVVGRFGDGCDFSSIQLRGHADFSESTFGNGSNFYRASADQNLILIDCRFLGSSNFSECRFLGDFVVTKNVTGEKKDGSELGPISFRGSLFRSRAVFVNRRFTGPTDFRDVVFHVAPEFFGADFHQSFDFRSTSFLDRRGNDAVDAAAAYRRLRLAMEGLRAREEQAKFYKLEHLTLRNTGQMSAGTRFVSWLYEALSDYGLSVGRPINAFLIGTLVFFALYHMGCIEACGSDVSGAVYFTADQIFRPFVVWNSGYAPHQALSSWHQNQWFFRVTGSVHSLYSIGCLALFLLALRWKFKKD